MSKFKAGDEVVIVRHLKDSAMKYIIGDVDIVETFAASQQSRIYFLQGNDWWVDEECLELNNPQLENE